MSFSEVSVEMRSGQAPSSGICQFMSIVLKTHSVNFLSLAVALYDSSWSRWLSSRKLWTCTCSDAFASFSWQ